MGVAINFETRVTGVTVFQDETSEIRTLNKMGMEDSIHARFIVDASGYGRVIPRLFKLDVPSILDPRGAVFAHVRDVNRSSFEEPDRILILVYAPGIWVWIIPFSKEITSLGFVGNLKFFEGLEGSVPQQFQTLIAGNDYLKKRFSDSSLVLEPRKLEAWSVFSEKFYGNGFVLTGNATEFLDPIFSSGVMLAMVSSQMASKLVIKKLNGLDVDWDREYATIIQQGVDTFKGYVMAWYDGTLEKVFFAQDRDPEISKQICSVLAGYVWDQKNIYVSRYKESLNHLARLIDLRTNIAT